MKPSIGRIVHYHGPGNALAGKPGAIPPKTYPATVVEADGDACTLFVMTHVGHMILPAVPFAEEPKPDHWSWPPRV